MTKNPIPPHSRLHPYGETYEDSLRYDDDCAEYRNRTAERLDGLVSFAGSSPEPGPATVQPAAWHGTEAASAPGVLIYVHGPGDQAVFVPYHALPDLIEHLEGLVEDLGTVTGMTPAEDHKRSVEETKRRGRAASRRVFQAAADAGELVF